jgi:hypothetical protein
MTEPTTPPADGVTPEATPNPDGDTPKPPTAEDIANLTKALEKERELRKARDRELGEFKAQTKASMTEAERAAAEAEERGYSKARTEYGARLAETEFRAAAAARNPDPEAAVRALRHLNLAGLLDEHGEPNGKAITAAVADLIPEATAAGPAGPPSFDGGARTTAPAAPDMNALIRQAAGRA